MPKPKVLLPIGLPASGKTQFSKSWMAEDPDARVRVNWDDLRLGMFGEGWVFNRRDEKAMKRQSYRIAEKALQAGLSVVVDNTNLSAHTREVWKQLALRCKADYAEQDIPTDIGVCIARDRARTARVGQAVIDSMALRYGYLDWDIVGRFDALQPKPIAIVDIDGTVANDRARLRYLSPVCASCGEDQFTNEAGQWLCDACDAKGPHKDWQAYFGEVSNDLPIGRMINLLERLHDHLIVFISGRPIMDGATKVGIMTEDWLLGHNIRFDRLFLKDLNTHQPSPDFKKEIIEYLPKERISYVFEDDPRCVEMYRRELPNALVAHVAERIVA